MLFSSTKQHFYVSDAEVPAASAVWGGTSSESEQVC